MTGFLGEFDNGRQPEAYPDEDLVDGYQVQRPQDEVVNIPDNTQGTEVQLPFSDLKDDDVKRWNTTLPEDLAMVDEIHASNVAGDQDVPFEWQYWLHDETTLPPVTENPNPQMPSGWVDPVTGELVP